MNQDRRKILEMLAAGSISVNEADQLLAATDVTIANETIGRRPPKFLRLLVEPKAAGDSTRKIDIRVPLGVVRNSLQIAQCVPATSRGPMTVALGTHTLDFDLSGMNPENVDDFVAQFADLSTDIEKQDETLRLFCE